MAKDTEHIAEAQAEALRRELDSLRQAVCEHRRDSCRDLDGPGLLAVFRLFPKLSVEDFDALTKNLESSSWLTLPVDQQAYPQLTRIQETLEELAFQADHDPLTGLPNRRALERTLDMEMERARRDKTPISLAILDIDDFKHVNDSHGHAAGDAVLVALAGLLTANIRRYDTAGRLGGEEFALIFPGIGRAKAAGLLERLMVRFRATLFTAPDGQTFRVTCSAGLAAYRGSPDMSLTRFMDLADKALYQAKESGKDRIARAPAPAPDPALKRTLVRASEKRFLFTGEAPNADQPEDEP